MKKKSKRWLFWIGGIFIFLLIIHTLLPFILVRYVNKSLDNIPEHTGSVDWIHMNLFRGAYVIHDLKIFKEEGNFEDPFVSSPQIDLSLEWKALFNGRIVGEIVMTDPVLTFIVPSDSAQGKQTGENVDWTKPLKDLMPITINRLEIKHGTIYYKDPSAEPKVDIYLKEMNAVATNLSNAANQNDELPSDVDLSAVSIGEGKLSVRGELDIIKEVPDFDVDMSFEDVDLTALNDFIKAYAKADIESGTLNFYTEFKGRSGKLDGYVKPLFLNMKFVDAGEEGGPLKLVWESIIGTLTEIFENQEKDQFGTKVPIEGSYGDVSGGVLPAIGNVLKNAFVEAFKGKTDDSIDFNENED